MDLRARTRPQRCPLCHAGFGGEVSPRCPACEVPHHLSCWSELGGCATLGCSEQATLSPAPARRGAFARALRRDGPPLAFGAAFTAFSAVAIHLGSSLGLSQEAAMLVMCTGLALVLPRSELSL